MFPRDVVKSFPRCNLCWKFKTISTGLNAFKTFWNKKNRTSKQTRVLARDAEFNFYILSPSLSDKSILLLLFTDCVYIDSQRPDVAYFICAIKEFRMVSFLSLFFFSLSMFMFNFLLVDSRWPFSSFPLHLLCLFLFSFLFFFF